MTAAAIAALGSGKSTEAAADEAPSLLYVQSFGAGSLAPNDGGGFILRLEQGHGQTISFSDRPDRLAGAIPTVDFVRGFAESFGAGGPPNAALVAQVDGATEVVVLELTAAAYDPSTHVATYQATILADADAFEFALQRGASATGETLTSFGAAALFIDDLGPLATGNLFVNVTDESGAALPGVTVTLSGIGAPQTEVTDANGAARFIGLEPGAYSIEVQLEGFSTESQSVTIRIGANTAREVTLSAAVEE